MALRVKTVEYAFDPRLTTLATNTALGTATRYDTNTVTISLPETTSRTFRSVILKVSWRCGVTTTASNYTGWRLGINLGGVGASDQDYTPTAIANSGESQMFIFDRDVTSYFTTNWTGTSMVATRPYYCKPLVQAYHHV